MVSLLSEDGFVFTKWEMAQLDEMSHDVGRIGSYWILDAWDAATSDIDYLVYLKGSSREAFLSWARETGFVTTAPGRASTPGSEFISYKRGRVNLIITFNEDFYLNGMRAQILCEKLRLWDRDDRVLVWQAFLYDGEDE